MSDDGRSRRRENRQWQRPHVHRKGSWGGHVGSIGADRDCGARFSRSSIRASDHDDVGSTLILALAFLLIGSLLVTTLASWTTNDLNNTSRFRYGQSVLYAADGAAQVALAASRYTYPPATQLVSSSPSFQYSGACLSGDPITINSLTMAAVCSTSVDVGFSRLLTIQVFADPTGAVMTSNPNTAPLLTATIGFVDNVVLTGPAPYTCTPVPSSDCGTVMEILSWKVQQQP